MINDFFFKKAESSDIPLIQSIVEKAPTYSLIIEGVLPHTDVALKMMNEMPPKPGFSAQKKYIHIIFYHAKPIGLTDLLDGYPDEGTAFIGLFMLTEDYQKRGLGKKAYHAYESLIREAFKPKKLRLAIVEANPVSGFWQKCGFEFTGEKKPYISGLVESQMLLMEKK